MIMPASVQSRTVEHTVWTVDFGRLAFTWIADELGTDNHAGTVIASVTTFHSRTDIRAHVANLIAGQDMVADIVSRIN